MCVREYEQKYKKMLELRFWQIFLAFIQTDSLPKKVENSSRLGRLKGANMPSPKRMLRL